MAKLTKILILSFSIWMPSESCKHHDNIWAAKPLGAFLVGNWTLEKIVTPTRTLVGSQIGYSERRVERNENGDDVERIFRNDTLYAKYICARNPAEISNEKNKTILVSYRGGLKRFYKLSKQDGKPMAMEASDYLPEIGTEADTVKFFYREVW